MMTGKNHLFEICFMLLLWFVPKSFVSFRKSPSRIKRIIYVVVIGLAVYLASLASGLIYPYMMTGLDTILSYLYGLIQSHCI